MNDLFASRGLRIGGVLHLSPREAYDVLQKGATLIDLRRDLEVNGKQFQVERVIHLPHPELARTYATILPPDPDTPLVLADSVGVVSREAAVFLASRGYRQLASLNGGIIDWEKDGLPTGVTDDEMLIGQCACKLRPKKAYRGRRDEADGTG